MEIEKCVLCEGTHPSPGDECHPDPLRVIGLYYDAQDEIAALRARLAAAEGRANHLEVERDRYIERADRGCHSGCLEHEVISTSHHPDCMREKHRAMKMEHAALEERADGLQTRLDSLTETFGASCAAARADAVREFAEWLRQPDCGFAPGAEDAFLAEKEKKKS